MRAAPDPLTHIWRTRSPKYDKCNFDWHPNFRISYLGEVPGKRGGFMDFEGKSSEGIKAGRGKYPAGGIGWEARQGERAVGWR